MQPSYVNNVWAIQHACVCMRCQPALSWLGLKLPRCVLCSAPAALCGGLLDSLAGQLLEQTPKHRLPSTLCCTQQRSCFVLSCTARTVFNAASRNATRLRGWLDAGACEWSGCAHVAVASCNTVPKSRCVWSRSLTFTKAWRVQAPCRQCELSMCTETHPRSQSDRARQAMAAAADVENGVQSVMLAPAMASCKVVALR